MKTLSYVLRAMAEDCLSGQRTGKSDRWALTLRSAADTLEQLVAERDRLAASAAAKDAALDEAIAWLEYGTPWGGAGIPRERGLKLLQDVLAHLRAARERQP